MTSSPPGRSKADRVETRGRPRIKDDDEILSAALRAFAHDGFEGMSLRMLNRELGLSHGTINRRFESKERLYYSAVDHGFGGLFAAVASEVDLRELDGAALTELRERVRSFLVVSSRRPELVRLMNSEGLDATERLDYIWTSHIEPAFRPFSELLTRLSAEVNIRSVSGRSFFFLLTHGAAAPFTLQALSERFDGLDGVLDAAAHAEMMADVLVGGLLSP